MADFLAAPDPEIHILSDRDAVADYVVRQMVAMATAAVELRGRATVVLSGGSTPEPIYTALPSFTGLESVQWLLGDERLVGPDDPRSNQSMIRRSLLDRLALPSDRLIAPDLQSSPEQVITSYTASVEKTLAEDPEQLFDLTLLGLGDDGHTASLFPGIELSTRTTVQLATAPSEPRHRISLTASTLNRSRMVLFVVLGGGKAEAVRRAVLGGWNPKMSDPEVPSSWIRPPQGRLIWVLDTAASSGLDALASVSQS